ncbi:MAG: bifunctional oligoribonuclease/PAP phosphatase NrnA [Thermodesulfovibrionia bacterium]|nr:bifunctional oligoribonuclease/PAP phosphatase NrnA [Thermodesulfovibrionia bacterium]
MKISPKLLKLIKANKNFLIVSHINPEGDAIGSCIALALGLKKIGKSVYILNRDPVPDILKFLPCSNMLSRKIPSREFDVLFVVDCSTFERTGLKKLNAKTSVIIDHHLPSPVTGSKSYVNPSINIIDPKASATGELIYKLLHALAIPVDRDMAVNLYAAIYTDTGGFRYSNMNSETLKIASKLIEAGANPWEVTKEVYESFPLNRLKLLALSLATLEKKDKIAWITVARDMYKKTNTSVEDTENFVDFPRAIKGVEVAVLFREDGKNLYKISFRSRGTVNVEKIARTFGGGGHANAAGCRFNGSLSKIKEKLSRAVREAMKNI